MSRAIYLSSEPIPAGARLGGKAGALNKLSSTGLPIPEWFVIVPEALAAASPGARFDLSPSIAGEVMAAANAMGGSTTLFAVRSSALD